TTRQPRDGEITGVDYNFVSVEEFFSLEESGALLESGKFKGNYYGTPRPVHIGPDSPPISYQEHRNLLRRFRTRSNIISRLVSRQRTTGRVHDRPKSGTPRVTHCDNDQYLKTYAPRHRYATVTQLQLGFRKLEGIMVSLSVFPDQNPIEHVWDQLKKWRHDHSPPRCDFLELRVARGSAAASSVPAHTSSLSQSRDSREGVASALENGLGPRRGTRVTGPESWGTMYSDSGIAYYRERHLKPSSRLSNRAHSHDNVCMTDFAEFTDQPTELRGFSVHTRLVKGSRGFGFNIVGGSRRREFLQIYSITPGGPATLRTGDILVYINDTCVLGYFHREAVEMLKAIPVGHTVDIVVRRGYPMLFNSDGCPKMSNSRLGCQDQSVHLPPPTTTQPQPQAPLPYSQPHILHNGTLWSDSEQGSSRNLKVRASRYSLDANGNSPPRAPSSSAYQHSNGFLRPPRTARSIRRLQSQELASRSDSEVVSAIGSHSTPPPVPRFPHSHTELSPGPVSFSPGGARRYSHLRTPQNALLTPPSSIHSDGPYFTFNGTASASSGSPNSSLPSPGPLSALMGGGVGGLPGGGELVPVALAKCERGSNMGFSVTAGGHGGRQTLVKKVWDHRPCNGLQAGDAIVKINGADVQSLSFAQVQRILQEHTKKGEVILLVYRAGPSHFSNSSNSVRRLTPPPPRSASDSEVPYIDSTPRCRSSLTPPSPALVRSSLVQSTSFLDSVPVTLTLEPRDWLSSEEGGTVLSPKVKTEEKDKPPVLRGYEVELKRKSGEGFGFSVTRDPTSHTHTLKLTHVHTYRAMLERLQSALQSVKDSK
ncbi:hypothetical protein DNTS_027255, partial [Danionella cerebrum]